MATDVLRRLIPSVHELEDNASQQVLEHFGPDAPGLLNAYACRLEDLLIEQQRQLIALREELALLKEKG